MIDKKAWTNSKQRAQTPLTETGFPNEAHPRNPAGSPGRYSRRIRSETRRNGPSRSASHSLSLSLPPPHPSLGLRLTAVGRSGSSVRIVVQYEGVGTLGSPNSQPRRDLARLHMPAHNQRNPLLAVRSPLFFSLLPLSLSLSVSRFRSQYTISHK